MNRPFLLRLLCPVLAVLFATVPTTLASKKAERIRVAEELTKEALHREIYGLKSERDRLLARAAAMDDDFAPAKWHQGLVRHRNAWIKAEDLPNLLAQQQRIADYRQVRERYPQTVQGQLELADWCAGRGLRDQERAHLTRVVTLDPDNTVARGRLGFQRMGFDWVTEEEIQEAVIGFRGNQAALARWRPQIEDIRRDLRHRSQLRRENAVDRLLAISDPEAATAIEAVLWNESEEAAQLMVRSLGAMPAHDVSLVLARQALLSPSVRVRESTARQLQTREMDSYVPTLLAMMYTPVTSRTDIFRTGGGRLLFRHTFAREGQDRREAMVVDSAFQRVALPGGDGRQTMLEVMEDAQENAVERDLGVIRQNLRTQTMNRRIAEALNTATEQELPADPEVWWQWWNEVNEVFTEGEKPLRSVRMAEQFVRVDRAEDLMPVVEPPTRPQPIESFSPPPLRRSDCLAAGTTVWTDRGTTAIEEVQVGDLVLSQDPETGELAYKPVLRTTVRPEGPLVRVRTVKGEAFETSGGHLFWVAGDGWIRARQLESGMELHGVGDTARVSLTEDGPELETYNLIVADFHTYFVGEGKLLCHDNTVRRPTDAVVPGLLQE